MVLRPPPEGKNFANVSILDKFINTYKIWQSFWPNLPKLTRYTLGEKIDCLFLEMLELIFVAIYAPKNRKAEIINKISSKFDKLKFFFRISWEIKALDNKKYAHISVALSEIGKMLGGWKKQILK